MHPPGLKMTKGQSIDTRINARHFGIIDQHNAENEIDNSALTERLGVR